MSIRIAHFSDLHYADETLEEVDRCFTFAVDAAIARQAQVAVISGDATDHALPLHSPAFLALARNVRRLADHCPVLMLQGTFSHEPAGALNLFGLIGGKHPIHVADRIGQVALTKSGAWVASENYRFERLPDETVLLASCIPTVNKAALAASLDATEAATALGEQLAHLLAGLAPSHRLARDNGIAGIGVTHGTVHGCMTEHGVPMAGQDHEFNAGSLFSAGAVAFMLGHIHLHQSWKDGTRLIAYPGSIGRLHYGEQGDKGFLMWEVDTDGARFDLVPTPARRMMELAFAGPPDLDALREHVAEEPIAGAWVRLRWQIAEEERHSVDRDALLAILSDAAGVKLEGRTVPVTRARASGMARCTQLEEQVRAWAEVVDTPSAPLLACLANLRHATPEQIAQAVIDASETAQPAAQAAQEPLACADIGAKLVSCH